MFCRRKASSSLDYLIVSPPRLPLLPVSCLKSSLFTSETPAEDIKCAYLIIEISDVHVLFTVVFRMEKTPWAIMVSICSSCSYDPVS